jgi:hypothetical protein
MFSHTTKGQPYNMELLSRFLRGRGSVGGRIGGRGGGENWTESRVGMEPRLVDYELILGEDGKRCVGFGWFAGGMFSFSKLLFYLFRPCATPSPTPSLYYYYAYSFIISTLLTRVLIFRIFRFVWNSRRRAGVTFGDGARPSRTRGSQSIPSTSPLFLLTTSTQPIHKSHMHKP